jgi:hypothetical protein
MIRQALLPSEIKPQSSLPGHLSKLSSCTFSLGISMFRLHAIEKQGDLPKLKPVQLVNGKVP